MRDEVMEVLENVAVRIQNNMAAECINASGRTSNSFHIESDDKGVRLVGGGEGTAPIGTLEIGRAEGDVPMGFVGIIKQWIIDKGIKVDPIAYVREPSEKWQPKYSPEERGLNARAGQIAHRIKTEGTQRHRNPRNDIYSNVVPQAVEEITKVILDNVVKTLTLH